MKDSVHRHRITARRYSPRKTDRRPCARQAHHRVRYSGNSGTRSRAREGNCSPRYKPENLFLTREGRAKVLDSGLAKNRPESAAQPNDATLPSGTRTSAGMLEGTVGYMSPEQVRGGSVDHRSDIFAFGTVIYEMLTAERAFRSGFRSKL